MENTTIAAGPQQYSALRVEYQPTALDGLDSTEQSLLDGAINVIARDVEQRCIPVERVSIKRHFSPEDESEELVLTIWVQAPSDIALDYWLTLAGTIAEWTSTLPQPYRDAVSERIAVAVRSSART